MFAQDTEGKCGMKFLTKFFDDESKIVGLCGFKCLKPNYNENVIMNDNMVNYFENAKTINSLFANTFETNFAKNTLLL